MKGWMLVCISALLPLFSHAQKDNFGFQLSAEGTTKVGNRMNVGLTLETRTRDGLGDVERLPAGIDFDYKIFSWLKSSCGYTFIGDHNRRISHYKENDRDVLKGLAEVGDPKNRRIYWGVRHRTHLTLTGTWKISNLKLSLRERWQYTYRCKRIVEGRYNYCYDKSDNAAHLYPSKSIHVLRSRLSAEYKIKHFAGTPHVSTELYNSWELSKIRCDAGMEWKLQKGHTLDTYYRYQHRRNGNADTHTICFEYKLKF